MEENLYLDYSQIGKFPYDEKKGRIDLRYFKYFIPPPMDESGPLV